jgi:hypothetical protein
MQLSAGETLPLSERSGVLNDDGTNCLPYKDPNYIPGRSVAQVPTSQAKCVKFWADLAAKPEGSFNTFTEGAGYLSDGTDCNPYKPK